MSRKISFSIPRRPGPDNPLFVRTRSKTQIPTATRKFSRFFCLLLLISLQSHFPCTISSECETPKTQFWILYFRSTWHSTLFRSTVACLMSSSRKHSPRRASLRGISKHQNKIFSVVSNYFPFVRYIFREMNDWMSAKHFLLHLQTEHRKLCEWKISCANFTAFYVATYLIYMSCELLESQKNNIFFVLRRNVVYDFSGGWKFRGWGWIL